MARQDGMIYVRVTKDEWKQMHERMDEVGMKNMSAFIRKMALNGYLIKLDLSDVKEVLRLLHINSNNLNQYAKQANTNGSIYYGDIQNLKRQHEELCNLLKAIYQRLLTI